MTCDCGAPPGHKVWWEERRKARERRVAEAAAPAPARETRRERNARAHAEYWATRRRANAGGVPT